MYEKLNNFISEFRVIKVDKAKSYTGSMYYVILLQKQLSHMSLHYNLSRPHQI